jgi:hypothetical protein
MISVTPGTETTLASITDPALTIQATILSADGRYAELALHSGAPLSPGTLIQFQSLETLYLGEIESQPEPDRARILIEHSIDLERAAAIRRLWNT